MKYRQGYFGVGLVAAVAAVTLLAGLTVGMMLGSLYATQASPIQSVSTLDELAALVEKYYVGTDYDSAAAELAAAKAYVSQLGDPYSFYYSETEYNDLTQSRNGKYAGIGITVQEKDGYLVVSKVNDNGPAHEAGILVGDLLITFNGTDMVGKKISEISTIVASEEGQDVTVTVRRDGTDRQFSMKAAVVTSDMARMEMLGTVAYFYIDSFYGNAGTLVESFIAEASENNCTGILVDLRNNPGGDLGVLLNLASDFVGKKMVLYMEYKDGSRDTYSGTHDALTDLPVVILINGNSASASEAFTGCLQVYGRAEVVGTQSFGKGIAQQTFRLSDGSRTALTVAKYYLPDDRCIHGQGITPDVIVEYKTADTLADDVQVQAALQILSEEK